MPRYTLSDGRYVEADCLPEGDDAIERAGRERFASKGGYLVHFTQPSGAQVLADTEWLVP